MTENMQSKYKRMNERLNELSTLNGNIARLAFYINENDMTDEMAQVLEAQREAMTRYRDILQSRIINGVY
ncbi:MAG: hypothetical protein PUF49_11380 [Firmicutes bacterium]|nr:hypothetical protein [Bacillota bacterium]